MAEQYDGSLGLPAVDAPEPVEVIAGDAALTDSHDIARAAGLVALGNVSSRVLGLVRESLSALIFGATADVSAFGVASTIPKQLYELFIGGMLNSALVPAFSGFVAAKREKELWRVFSAFLTLAALVLSLIIVILEVLAPRLTWLLAGGFTADQLAVTQRLVQIMLPSLLFVSLAGVVTAMSYARGQFLFPAIAVGLYNLGIIASMLLLAPKWHIYSLGVGVILASALQLAVQLPALKGGELRLRLDWRHPALRHVLALYAPVILGLVVTTIQVSVDRRLASGTGASSIAWMEKATTIIQSAHGLVAVAISTAVLPVLARHSARADWGAYRGALGSTLRLALWLIVPLAVGLILLGEPIIQLVFQRGQFTALDTLWTTRALRLYALGLVFATIDWPLNYAFYARQDTKTPAIVGVLSVLVYLAVALALVRPLGMLGLVLADSVKHLSHASIMLALTERRVQAIRGAGLLGTLGRTALATGAMAACVLAADWAGKALIAGASLPAQALRLLPAMALGAAVYLGLSRAQRMNEFEILYGAVARRFRHLRASER